MSFVKPSRRKSQEFRVPTIRFLGEQDGPPERLLKDRLTDFFQQEQIVTRAYLTRADFGEGKDVSVVLALRTRFGPNGGLVEKLGTIFADVFDSKEHLDILFLTDSQEAQLSKACPPFFKE